MVYVNEKAPLVGGFAPIETRVLRNDISAPLSGPTKSADSKLVAFQSARADIVPVKRTVAVAVTVKGVSPPKRLVSALICDSAVMAVPGGGTCASVAAGRVLPAGEGVVFGEGVGDGVPLAGALQLFVLHTTRPVIDGLYCSHSAQSETAVGPG